MAQVECAVWGGGHRSLDPASFGATPEELARAVLVPSFVDLCCEPGFPGFPVRETPGSLVAQAAAGGFGTLLLSPRVDPVLDTSEQLLGARTRIGGVRMLYAGALTRGLAGGELSECGLLQGSGAAALSDGGVSHRDTIVLKNALEYAAAFGMLVVLRPCDPDLDGVGVVHDSPLAAQLGMRGNSAASEEIGISRVVALVRATGARVHITHLGTAAGVELVERAIRAGLPVSASVPARNLLLVENDLDDEQYDSKYRLHPPLRSSADREALVAGVRKGVLLIAADHQPRAPEEKDHEFERAVSGSSGLLSAFAAAFTAIGELDAVVSALSLGPAKVLGQSAGTFALVDPAGTTVVGGEGRIGGTDALRGRTLRGRVLGVVAAPAPERQG